MTAETKRKRELKRILEEANSKRAEFYKYSTTARWGTIEQRQDRFAGILKIFSVYGDFNVEPSLWMGRCVDEWTKAKLILKNHKLHDQKKFFQFIDATRVNLKKSISAKAVKSKP